MATDEEVNEARERVESLRAKIAGNERARAVREQELANDITLAQLQAEEARLAAQLVQQEKTHTEDAVRLGAQSPIAAAEESMKRSLARAAAVEAKAQVDIGETESAPSAAPTSPVAPVAPVAPAATKTTKGK